jgi:predicted DCC family thiol-disulfide oxidoreductase YuxK
VRRPVLLYDADCRLCRGAARAVGRLDRNERLALLPLADDEARALLAALPEDDRFTSWHLAREGAITSGGAAAVDLLVALGFLRLAGAAAGHLDLVERLYRGISANRGRLGRLVPDGPAPRRYP